MARTNRYLPQIQIHNRKCWAADVAISPLKCHIGPLPKRYLLTIFALTISGAATTQKTGGTEKPYE